MELPDDIAALLPALDPTAQAVVQLVWRVHEQQLSQMELLTSELSRLRNEATVRDEQLAVLTAQNDKFRQMIFGRRSEKLPPMAREVRRQVEAEEVGLDERAALDLPSTATNEELAKERTKARRRKGRKASKPARAARRKALDKLPIVRERIAVRADQFPEGMTRDDFRPLGDGDIVRRIEHVREHLVIVEYELEKLTERGGDTIVTASTPPNVIEGGAYGPTVYARTIVAKCVDSLPLYRQERIFGRNSVPIARSVLCGLFHRAANLLEPLYDRLLALVRHDPYVHADETTLNVAEPHNARKAWLWTVLCESIVVYIYSETRAAETAEHALAGTQGHLTVDGYSGYNSVVGPGKRTRVGCWSHARRKFFDALGSAPEARELLELIVGLYRLEHEAADAGLLGTEAHALLRTERSTPIVDAIETWVDARTPVTPPKSPLGTALTYATNQRAALRVFLSDPQLPLDNNIAERALRIVALGRKNFLFVGHAEAGQNLSVLQSICATCLLHDVNPYEYLRDVLVRMQSHPASRIDELLPMNWKPPPERQDVGC